MEVGKSDRVLSLQAIKKEAEQLSQPLLRDIGSFQGLATTCLGSAV